MRAATVRLSPSELLTILQPWAEVAAPIHDRLARFADVPPESETLWVGCGAGRSVLWWAARFPAHVVGVDPDGVAIEAAEATSRTAGLDARVNFQTAAADDLPHETDVFDLTIVNVLQLRSADGRVVFTQVARVARPGSVVVALVPTWLRTPSEDEARRVRALGIHPRLLMEWKTSLRDAGLVELAVVDAAQDGGWIADGWLGLLLRGWRVSRWRGVRAVLGRNLRTFRRLAVTRALGLSLVRGVRWPHE